ncbi:MAG: sensor histidine kinase N-terminal domain-containing protein [Limnohabitans sp.]|nr:sensor histidine kinase N-terminal domain-containing protein [Limnohabitans sp.]
MKPRSIVRQVLSATLLTLLVLWIAMVVSVAWVIKHETDEIFDAGLQETAQRLLPLAVMRLQYKNVDEVGQTLEADENSLEPTQHEEYLVYQVFDASGRMLLRSHAAPETPLFLDLKQGFQRTRDHVIYIEKSRNGEFLLALAEKSNHRTDTFLSTIKFLLMPLLALLPLTSLGLLVILRKTSQPLRELDRELARRGSEDLHPLSEKNIPQELQPLTGTLNRLMARLKSALEAERSFTANSAHELRTPLAAALAQLHALELGPLNAEQQQRLITIRQLLNRLQTLSEKLLQLARAESGIAWKQGDVDLCQLLQLICNDHQWRTDIAIELRLPDETVTVQGDVDALGIVLGNLLENAVKYTNTTVPIHVTLTTMPVEILIINDCDPLHASALEHLNERFFRIRPDSRGAGLGLSIVSALLKASTINFKTLSPATGSDRGFEARLTWN